MNRNPKGNDGFDEDYGPTFITLVSEDGEEIELEYLDTLEYQGSVYMAFFPAVPEDEESDDLEDEDEYGVIILRVVEVDGEEQLVTPDTEEEAEAVYQQFMEVLFQEDEDEE